MKLFFGGEIPRTKTWKVGSLKNVNFNLLSFKRCPYDNDSLPISLGDLNIILGAWNGFSGKCHESCDRFFSYIKIFENTAFGHVTEMPNYDSLETLSVKYVELILSPFLQTAIALWRLKQI